MSRHRCIRPQAPEILSVFREKSVNKAGDQNFLPITIYHLKVCNGYLPPCRFRHRLSIEIGYAYRFALSSSSKYVFAKQPSPPEVYSTSTDNALNLNSLDIHISHRGLAAISWRHKNVTKNWAPNQMFLLYCQFKTLLNSSLIIYLNKKIKLIISDCCLSFLTFSK